MRKIRTKVKRNQLFQKNVQHLVQHLAFKFYDYSCKSILKKSVTITVYVLENLQAGACNFTKNEFFYQNFKGFY